nr:MAG TPA: hypothetical protein [Bacteriophage sp.]
MYHFQNSFLLHYKQLPKLIENLYILLLYFVL